MLGMIPLYSLTCDGDECRMIQRYEFSPIRMPVFGWTYSFVSLRSNMIGKFTLCSDVVSTDSHFKL